MEDKKIHAELDKAFWELRPVSSNDCTGLVQGMPDDDDEMRNYTDLYNLPEQGNLKTIMNSDGTIEGSSEQINTSGTDKRESH